MSDQNLNPDPSADQEDWQPCASGAVSGLVKRLKQKKQMRQVRRVGVVVSCLLAAVLIGLQLTDQPEGLSHDQVVELADEFVQDELSAEQTRLVEQHIARCPRCEHLLEERNLVRQQAMLVLPDKSIVMIDVPVSQISEDQTFVASIP